jgi:hypothetical protein
MLNIVSIFFVKALVVKSIDEVWLENTLIGTGGGRVGTAVGFGAVVAVGTVAVVAVASGAVVATTAGAVIAAGAVGASEVGVAAGTQPVISMLITAKRVNAINKVFLIASYSCEGK